MTNIHHLSEAIRHAYKVNQEDETLGPQVLTDSNDVPIGRIKSGDSVIFYNIRGEREVELSRSLTEIGFGEFSVERNFSCDLTTMIQYHKDLHVTVAFPPEKMIEDTLSDVLSAHHLKQVKITEAEKAIHVGFFLNGKKNRPRFWRRADCRPHAQGRCSFRRSTRNVHCCNYRGNHSKN